MDIQQLYKDLPVLIVQEWTQISQNLLAYSYEKFIKNHNNYSFEKLYMKYWKNIIHSHKSDPKYAQYWPEYNTPFKLTD
jgi:hypothetical protein